MNEQDFAERLAAPTPTPGGGAAAARVGLLATSLLRMVIGLTRKKADADADRELEAAAARAQTLAARFRGLEAADVEVFEGFMAALRLPRGTDEEKARRAAARAAAAERATEVPLDLLGAVIATLTLARTLQQQGERTSLAAASDLTCAVEFSRAAFLAAELNVDANLPYLGAEPAARAREERQRLRSQLDALYAELG